MFLQWCIDWVKYTLCEPNIYVFFALRITSGPSLGWRFVDSKSHLNPTIVYATDCSKAEVLVLFLFCVDLCFLFRGVSCWVRLALLFVLVCVCVCVCVCFVCVFCPLSIVISSHGEERDGLCASRALFVDIARVNFCLFSLPFGVRGWLLLVIVALPGLVY